MERQETPGFLAQQKELTKRRDLMKRQLLVLEEAEAIIESRKMLGSAGVQRSLSFGERTTPKRPLY